MTGTERRITSNRDIRPPITYDINPNSKGLHDLQYAIYSSYHIDAGNGSNFRFERSQISAEKLPTITRPTEYFSTLHTQITIPIPYEDFVRNESADIEHYKGLGGDVSRLRNNPNVTLLTLPDHKIEDFVKAQIDRDQKKLPEQKHNFDAATIRQITNNLYIDGGYIRSKANAIMPDGRTQNMDFQISQVNSIYAGFLPLGNDQASLAAAARILGAVPNPGVGGLNAEQQKQAIQVMASRLGVNPDNHEALRQGMSSLLMQRDAAETRKEYNQIRQNVESQIQTFTSINHQDSPLISSHQYTLSPSDIQNITTAVQNRFHTELGKQGKGNYLLPQQRDLPQQRGDATINRSVQQAALDAAPKTHVRGGVETAEANNIAPNAGGQTRTVV